MGPAELGALIPIVAIIGGCAVAIFRPLVSAYARRLDKRESVAPEVSARLERMEHSIEAIAVEVERISEGQRFTTRLLAERSGALQAGHEGVVPAAERRA
jgi:hypothetical protein